MTHFFVWLCISIKMATRKESTWKKDILQQLQQRNRQQSEAFAPIIEARMLIVNLLKFHVQTQLLRVIVREIKNQLCMSPEKGKTQKLSED